MSQITTAVLPESLAVAARSAAIPETDAQRRTRSGSGLDWFSFFCANLQTGFGPFVSVYLTTEKWSQTDIGIVLMIGGFVGLIGQVPGGAVVDRARSKTLIAAIAVIAIALAALMVASGSVFALILLAWIIHAAASCVITPCISTISLALVGHANMAQRIGRNNTFASMGSALAAGGMGAIGYYLSNQAVFFVTAALALPALGALIQIRASVEKGGKPRPRVLTQVVEAKPAATSSVVTDLKALAKDKALVVMASTIALYYLATASMLPLIGSMLTLRSAHSPTVFIAACIIVPQIMIALASPLVGRKAQSWGRRPLLLAGLAIVPLRGLLLGYVIDPNMLVAVQALDGITSAIIGVLIQLIAADVTRGTGRYALAQGVLGTAMLLGAALSATIAGVLTDKFGSSVAFYGLGSIGVVAMLVPLVLMPETRETSIPTSQAKALAKAA